LSGEITQRARRSTKPDLPGTNFAKNDYFGSAFGAKVF
jgi:hypothetical protein